ncbi:MAG: ABC transporter substrate-binding protein [Lachnospiraceae bacterium]|nr:ABC transporter substrate-binding protein [Lachnospiraceae bacterium]
MKKLICILMTLVMVGLTACGSTGNTPAENEGNAAVQDNEEAVADTSTTEPAAEADKGEKVVTMGVTGAWMSLCHVLWPSKDVQMVFTAPLFDTPAIPNSEGKIEPRLLSSWEATDDTYSVYVAKVNPDAYWHDGEKVTAQDFVFTFKTLLNPAFDGEFQDKFLLGTDDGGKCADPDSLGIEALDDETVQFTLKSGMAADTYFAGFRYCYVIPEHLLKDVDPAALATDPFWENPVGTGPFKFDSYIDGERMEYVVNDNYYLGTADFDRLIIKVVDSSALLSALMSGDVDMTAYSSALSANDLKMAEESENLNTVVTEGYAHDHLLINNKKFDTAQRIALNYIVDKSLCAQAAFGEYATPAIAMFRPEHPFYSSVIEDLQYEHDAQKGIQMLQEAGFDFNQTYTIHVQSDQPQRVAAATVLQQTWTEAGIKCEIIQADMATISAGLFEGSFDFAVMGSAGTNYNPTNEGFYYWVDGWNQMTDPTAANLVDAIDTALTFEEQYELCEQFQEFQMKESPMIYLFHRMQTFTISKRISGCDVGGFGLKNWKYWEWTVE